MNNSKALLYFTNMIVETANKGIVDECEENSYGYFRKVFD